MQYLSLVCVQKVWLYLSLFPLSSPCVAYCRVSYGISLPPPSDSVGKESLDEKEEEEATGGERERDKSIIERKFQFKVILHCCNISISN